MDIVSKIQRHEISLPTAPTFKSALSNPEARCRFERLSNQETQFLLANQSGSALHAPDAFPFESEITREQELHRLTQLWMRNTAHNPVLAEGHD